jgi:hypothetical protein
MAWPVREALVPTHVQNLRWALEQANKQRDYSHP